VGIAMNDKIFPGSVFAAHHVSLDTSKVTTHLFVCIYSQELDNSITSDRSDIKGLLITSKPLVNRYSVPLSKLSNNFLKLDSYCLCDKEFNFVKESVQVLGTLDIKDILSIAKSRETVHYSESYQLSRSIENLVRYQSKSIQKFIDKYKSSKGGD
jgi:hypothetical protein